MENSVPVPQPVTATPTAFTIAVIHPTTTRLTQAEMLRNKEYGKELQLGLSPPAASAPPPPTVVVPTPNHPFSTLDSQSSMSTSQDHHHHQQYHYPNEPQCHLSEHQYYSYLFSPDYSSSSPIFPVFPLMVDPSAVDNGLPSSLVGGLLDGYYPDEKFIDNGLENSCFLESMTQSQGPQQSLWGSITKAARSKRRIARRMSSTSSSSRVGHLNQTSSSSFSTSLGSFLSPPPNKNISFFATDTSSNSDTDNKRRELFTFTTPDNKKLRLLLQKELKNSDVNSLGRIVLPKKDSEANLPTLTVKEGFQITVRDLVSTKVWHMKYRFWPNNKSRMYVLENTGDFVKQKGLKVGDSILLYQDEDEQFFICAKRAEEPPLELLKKELEECKVEHRAHSSERRMMEEDEHCDPFVVLETEVDTQEKVKLGKGKMIMLEDYGCSDTDTCGGSSSTQLGKEVVESQSLNKEAAGDFDCVFSELEMLPNFGACDLSLYNDFMSDFSDPGGENRVVAK